MLNFWSFFFSNYNFACVISYEHYSLIAVTWCKAELIHLTCSECGIFAKLSVDLFFSWKKRKKSTPTRETRISWGIQHQSAVWPSHVVSIRPPLSDRMSPLTLSFLRGANESGRILSSRQMVAALIKF